MERTEIISELTKLVNVGTRTSFLTMAETEIVCHAIVLLENDGKALPASSVVQCQSVLIKNAERPVKAETALKLMPYTRHLDFCKMDMPVEPRCTCGFEKIVDELTD